MIPSNRKCYSDYLNKVFEHYKDGKEYLIKDVHYTHSEKTGYMVKTEVLCVTLTGGVPTTAVLPMATIDRSINLKQWRIATDEMDWATPNEGPYGRGPGEVTYTKG